MPTKPTTPIPDPEPLATLTQDTLDHLDGIVKELDQAKKGLEALESLGIDSSLLREKIEWGYNARDMILKFYGKKV